VDKVYYLDLQTLLEYLQGQSALLSTKVTVPNLQTPCTGYLFFKQNAIIGCLIQTSIGTIWREGEEAYRFLKANEEWQVHIDPNIEQTFWALKQQSSGYRQEPAQSPSSRPYAPRQIHPLDPHMLNQFPTKQRLILHMVYTLANGQRTVEQMKAQIRLPGEIVDDALASLRFIGVIE
jgi:hypothetical protein